MRRSGRNPGGVRAQQSSMRHEGGVPVARGPGVSRPRGWTAAVVAGLALAAAAVGQGSSPEPTNPGPAGAPPEAPPSESRPESREVRETELTFKDGRTVTGVVQSRDGTRIVLLIADVPTTFLVSDLAGVRDLPTVGERYAELRAALDPADLNGRLRLAEWLRARGRLDLALIEVDAVLAKDPTVPDAKELRRLILAQVDVEQHSRERRPSPRPAPTPSRPPPRDVDEFPLLSEAQINILRVYEIDTTNPPRISIPRETAIRLLDRYAGQGDLPTTREGREAFLRRPAIEILEAMFRVQARDLYPEVIVHNNPDALQRFRDDVHRGWLANSCATTECHGGSEAGRLRLFPRRPNSDPSAFTNFLILERFRTREGLPLIDYLRPSESLLLHYGLPRDQTRFPHPEVDGPGRRWRPVFRSREDARFERTMDWIRAMYQPRPEYPIEYVPPGAAVPQPAPAPSEGAGEGSGSGGPR